MGHQADAMMNPWDPEVQEYHGGQEWAKLKVFVEDFSVTTNCFGPPLSGIKAVKDAIKDLHHYPSADQEPAKTDLARFLCTNKEKVDDLKSRLLLGNGASELIDLVIRYITKSTCVSSSSNSDISSSSVLTWKTGPFQVQYMEYERSATNQGWKKLTSFSNEKADVLCIVNPNNPTGEVLSRSELKEWIQTHGKEEATVIIDESMQPWHSSEWRDHSFLREHHPRTFILHSWTKLWCCTGLRLGSIVCPTSTHASSLLQAQVPWSVNVLALHFLSAVIQDDTYLEDTWKCTKLWRASQVQLLQSLGFQCYGAEYLSWIWIDVHSATLAQALVQVSRDVGTPIRHGLHGYHQPQFVRIKVAQPHHFDVLYQAWKTYLQEKLSGSVCA